MAYYPPSYFDLTDVWNHFKSIALSKETEPSEKATIVRVMIEIEVIRREMRGIPRLKAHSIAELAQRPPKRAKTITIRDAKSLEPSKESLSKTDPSPHHPPSPGTETF